MDVPRLNRSASQILAVIDPETAVLDLYSERGAEVYHAMTRGDDGEVREILRVARRTSGDILELACGSGRLTMPLARLGREVVGMDDSRRMLELLVENVTRAGIEGVQPVPGDMSAFQLDREFGLIVLATTSISLLGEHQRRAAFDCARRHLTPAGILLVSVHTSCPVDAEANTIVVPLQGDEPDVVLLSDEANPFEGVRDVGVVRIRRSSEGPVAEAFASRVHLVDEPQISRELQESGLVVRHATRVRSATGLRSVSMIECSR